MQRMIRSVIGLIYQYLEYAATTAPDVAPSGRARRYFDSALSKFKASLDGAAWRTEELFAPETYADTDDIAVPAIGDFALLTWAHAQGYAYVLDATCKVQTDQGLGYAYADEAGFRVTRLDQREDTGQERDGNTEVWLVENVSYAGAATNLHLILSVQGVA